MPHLDIWDYLTFLSFFILAVAGISLVVFLLGLPGRIAYARKHPEADAVNIMPATFCAASSSQLSTESSWLLVVGKSSIIRRTVILQIVAVTVSPH